MSRFTLLVAAMAVCGSAHAQSMTGFVTTTMVRTGWNSDAFAVVTAEPVINPASCAVADGYGSNKTMPGYQTFLAASLTAFSLNVPVVVTVHNSECTSSGRPKLIGINLAR